MKKETRQCAILVQDIYIYIYIRYFCLFSRCTQGFIETNEYDSRIKRLDYFLEMEITIVLYEYLYSTTILKSMEKIILKRQER